MKEKIKGVFFHDFTHPFGQHLGAVGHSGRRGGPLHLAGAAFPLGRQGHRLRHRPDRHDAPLQLRRHPHRIGGVRHRLGLRRAAGHPAAAVPVQHQADWPGKRAAAADLSHRLGGHHRRRAGRILSAAQPVPGAVQGGRHVHRHLHRRLGQLCRDGRHLRRLRADELPGGGGGQPADGALLLCADRHAVHRLFPQALRPPAGRPGGGRTGRQHRGILEGAAHLAAEHLL